MASDLQKAQEKVLQQEEGSGNQKEASKLLLELKVSETKPVREDGICRILFLLLINENGVRRKAVQNILFGAKKIDICQSIEIVTFNVKSVTVVKIQNTTYSNYQNLHCLVNIYFQEILSTFLHWQGKIDSLFDSSKNVVPVQLRTKPLDHYRPVTALCNYKTKEVCVVRNILSNKISVKYICKI